MWSLQQKQQYLKEQIPENLREDFWNYLEDEVGNYQIQKWNDSFIIKIVDAFKQKKTQEQNSHQTSFYHYQANPHTQSVSTENILSDIEQQESQKTEPINQQAQQAPKKQSAFALLDSIFKKKQHFPSQSKPNPSYFKTGPVSFENHKQEVSSNSFASNQFWEMGSKGHKVSKTTADFASFDFWSQPSSTVSSPQSSKVVKLDNKDNKSSIKDQMKPSIPSFDELLLNYENSKKQPSPYTKKSNVEEIILQKKESKKNQSRDQKIKEEKQRNPKRCKSQGKNLKKAKKGKVLYDGEIVIKQQFQHYVKCFPAIEREKLKDTNLMVKIEDHQIVQRTFLLPDYAMYHIKVIPLNIIIKRNYEDFSRLKATLSKLFPGTKIAYLQTNSWFSKTNADFIESQKKMLQFFLNDLILNPEIRNSKIFQDFITLPDHKMIKRRFQQWEKLQAPKGIQELCWLGGKVEVNLSQQQRLYHDNYYKYHYKIVEFLQKQQRLTQTLHEQYVQLDFTQNELINLTKNMIKQTISFNEKVYDLQLQQMNDTLKVINKCLIEENNNTKFHLDSIQEIFLPFIRYEKENVSEMEELINLQQSFFKNYLKRASFEKTQDIPYTSDRNKQFKDGVLNQSKNFLVFKYQAGFISNQLCNEGHRVIETLAQKYYRIYLQYSQMCKKKSKQMYQFWTQQLDNPIPGAS